MADEAMVREFKDRLAKLFGVDASELTDDKSFSDDLYITSLHYYGMISSIKQLSGKTVTFPQIKACKTVGEAVSLLED